MSSLDVECARSDPPSTHPRTWQNWQRRVAKWARSACDQALLQLFHEHLSIISSRSPSLCGIIGVFLGLQVHRGEGIVQELILATWAYFENSSSPSRKTILQTTKTFLPAGLSYLSDAQTPRNQVPAPWISLQPPQTKLKIGSFDISKYSTLMRHSQITLQAKAQACAEPLTTYTHKRSKHYTPRVLSRKTMRYQLYRTSHDKIPETESQQVRKS
jgi:hypothetical protein